MVISAVPLSEPSHFLSKNHHCFCLQRLHVSISCSKSSGQRKEDKETWWWNSEVQESVQRKRLVKKRWDSNRTEEKRLEYKERTREVKREVAKTKHKSYEELHRKEGEKDLDRLTKQRNQAGKDVQELRLIKVRDGNIITN